MATIIWQGNLAQGTFRVVDAGAGQSPRLFVEQQQHPDAMGTSGWSNVDPLSRAVFEALLIAAHVVT